MNSHGMLFSMLYASGIAALYVCTIYSHIKLWVTEPGYPERVSTATTPDLKIAIDKSKTKLMSDSFKNLLSKRSKGFVALLNNNLPNFSKFQNQCFKCDLKPLKPLRSYHCWTCSRDIMYRHQHCVLANNCVGLQNFRFFLGFILYSTLSLIMMMYPFAINKALPEKDSI